MSACVPAIQSEELLSGYLCRVDACSGRLEVKPTERSFADFLSTTKLDKDTIVYGHSGLPYARFVNVAQAGKPAHLHSDLYLGQTTFAFRVQRDVMRLCRLCFTQDLESLGFGYWRRPHQLAGIELCATHQTELTELPKSTLRRVLIPKTVECRSPQQNASRHPLVARFAELSTMALRASCALHPERIADVLSNRAQQRGIRLKGQRSGPKFSELVRDQMPAEWLVRHFGDTKPEKTMDGIFSAYIAPYRTASYLLAMTVLWDSSEEAMAACTAPQDAGVDLGSTVGMRMINAVLAGASVRAACRQENGRSSDFESTLRLLLGGQPALSLQ